MPSRVACSWILIVVALIGCRSVPEPLPLVAVPLETGVRVFAGDAIRGPWGEVQEIKAGEGLLVACTLLWAERMPWEAMEPLSAATRLVLESRRGAPYQPAADLVSGARVGLGVEVLEALLEGGVGRTLPLLEAEAALGEGLTARFFARSDAPVLATNGAKVFRLTSILVGRIQEAGGTRVALELEDLSLEEEAKVPRRQVVVLEAAPEIATPLVLALPSLYPGAHAPEALLAVIEIRRLDPTDHAALIEQSLEQALAAGASTANAGETADFTMARGLEALGRPRLRRAALVFLAGQVEAPLALDLALVGDTALLETWAEELLAAREGTVPEAFPWLMERSAYALLARGLDRDELVPALRGLLARHAGEAGRFPGTLSGLLDRAAGRGPFEALVIEENLAFLELEDPASRVRAFDWLADRGLGPEGFLPLAGREERTEKLDRFFEAREANR